MLHRVKEKKLGRDAEHRKALVRNLSTSLILNKQVETTLAKAKYVRPFFEKLVTKAKKDRGLTTVKYARTKLTTEDAVKALINDVAPFLEKRTGGYIRIVKLPERKGDNAPMARMELLVEKPKKEPKAAKKSEKAPKVEKAEVEAEDTTQEEIKAEE